MKLLGIVTLVAASITTSAIPLLADDKSDPRERLETAIPEAIRQLEAKDYKAFLQSFVPPELLEKMQQTAPLDELAKKFNQRNGAKVLEALKAIKDAKPMLDAEGTKATFEVSEKIGNKKAVTFEKIGKRWYIQN